MWMALANVLLVKTMLPMIICKISLKDHPTASHLQVGTVSGHTVVVGRHYDEGTLGFFIPDGTIISDKLAEEMWVKGKLSGKNRNRVKARDMQGVFSEGLFYGSRYFMVESGVKIYTDSPSWNPEWVDGQEISIESIQ